MIPVQETDHAGTGRALLIDQFRGQHAIRGILGSLMAQVQEIEDATFETIAGRILDGASDAQLDSLGDLVGETRQGRGDTEYREAIRLRIRVNRSQGRAEDVIQVASISTEGVYLYREFYPAGFEVDAFDLPAPRTLQGLIKETRAVATRGILVSSNWPTSENFVYGSVYGAVTGENGFGSVYDGSLVSKFTSSQDA